MTVGNKEYDIQAKEMGEVFIYLNLTNSRMIPVKKPHSGWIGYGTQGSPFMMSFLRTGISF